MCIDATVVTMLLYITHADLERSEGEEAALLFLGELAQLGVVDAVLLLERVAQRQQHPHQFVRCRRSARRPAPRQAARA